MKLVKILSEILELPPEEFYDNLVFRNLSTWDSMAHMMMIARIETEFNVQLSSKEIVRIQTLMDLKDVLKGLGAEFDQI
jgi:acyl carrier protein